MTESFKGILKKVLIHFCAALKNIGENFLQYSNVPSFPLYFGIFKKLKAKAYFLKSKRDLSNQKHSYQK